jgi:hypothetical protein
MSKAYLSLINKSNAKTNNRWTAEHSLIGSMSLLIVVALTHFYVVDDEDVEWRGILKQLSEEELMLYSMVSDFYGDQPVRCIAPRYLTNQDDTTYYICECIQPDKSDRLGGLVARASLQSSSTLSIYHKEDTNKMNGTRVKKHCISNSTGDTASIGIYISHSLLIVKCQTMKCFHG